jgi:hypothetical protein
VGWNTGLAGDGRIPTFPDLRYFDPIRPQEFGAILAGGALLRPIELRHPDWCMFRALHQIAPLQSPRLRRKARDKSPTTALIAPERQYGLGLLYKQFDLNGSLENM